MKLDHSVYPDLDRPPPEPADLATLEDQADSLQRVCAQWDYGIVPEPDTCRRGDHLGPSFRFGIAAISR